MNSGGQESLASHQRILWQSESPRPIATRIALCGDFLPAGSVPDAATDWSALADGLSPHFADVDAMFANLECPVDVAGLTARKLTGIGQIVSAGPETLRFLKAIHCAAVGFANNHAYDFGAEGVERTRAAVFKSGFRFLGVVSSLAAAPATLLWRSKSGLCVGFWAAARASHDLATRKSAGVEPATVARAAEAAARLKAGGAHFTIALVHAGCIRANRPSPEDVSLLRSIAISGFSLVAASHSHRIGAAETLGIGHRSPAFCFYGLGSIASGYTASSLEREGLVVTAGFDAEANLQEIAARPVALAANGIGAVPNAQRRQEILCRFDSLSAEIRDGSYRPAFYREISSGLIQLYLRDARSALQSSGVHGLAKKAARVRLHHVKRLLHGAFIT